MAKQQSQPVGLWLVGACGGVGTTVTLGLEAIRRGWAEPIGLIGHLPPFDKLALTPLTQWVVGGHEIRQVGFEAAAREMQTDSGIFSDDLMARCGPWLRQCDRNLRAGTVLNCGPTIARLADRPASKRKKTAAATLAGLTRDIRSFARRHQLRHVVVVNVASTEPRFKPGKVHQKWTTLCSALEKKSSSPLPASSLYALAAIEAGASYINFTPSVGIDLPGLRERADAKGTAYMGGDGKTGETLLKSVLAPLFAARNLPVLSWVGHNIFGNRDGQVLDDPRNKSTKTRSKNHLVSKILGYQPQTVVSIEYVPSLGD